MSFFKPKRKSVGQIDTVRLPDGPISMITGAVYGLLGTPYFDVNIIRGSTIIVRGCLKDEGYDYFTVANVGTFVLPGSEDIERHLRRGCCTKLFYRLENSRAGDLLDEGVTPSEFEYPVFTPAAFQAQLEAKTLADLLSEEESSYTWIIWLIAIVFVGIIVLSFFGGI